MTQHYANADSNGNIIAYYNDDVWEVSNIPKTAIQITEAQWQDAIANPGKYIVQNSSFVLAPAPTAAQQLTAAQSAKIASLTQSFNNSLLNGFTSSADSTSRLYPIDPVSMAKLTSASTVINGGKVPSIVIKDFNGNKVTLTAAQYQQMAADGFTFYNNQEQHLWSLEDQVNAATTVSAVNAITW